MTFLTNYARSEGDPKLIRSGAGSVGAADRLAKGLGWFSIGLGLVELLAPRRVTRALGMEGNEVLIQAYGAREIGAGIMSLSVDKQLGLWSRVAGDGIDIATLMTGLRHDNPKRDNVSIALAAVIGVTILDVVGAQALQASHGRSRAPSRGATRGHARDYSDRSGFPGGVAAARGRAKDFQPPKDFRAAPAIASSL